MNVLGRLGVAAAIAMAAYMLFNAAAAWFDPAGFAVRLGLPITSDESAGWVRIYGLRAAFLGLAIAGLTLSRQWRALSLFSVAAAIMPIGDALLTSSAGAPVATVLRHAAIIGIVLVLALLLDQAAKSAKG